MSGVNWMDGESEGRQEDLALSTTGRVYGPYSLLYILAFAVDRRHAELIWLTFSYLVQQGSLHYILSSVIGDPELMRHSQIHS